MKAIDPLTQNEAQLMVIGPCDGVVNGYRAKPSSEGRFWNQAIGKII